MTLSLDLLCANLVELHAWAQSSEASLLKRPEELLVPNKSGTRLYNRGHLMGRLWGVYWTFVHLGSKHDPVPLQLELTFEKIVLAFKEHQLNARRDNDIYLDQLLNIPGVEPLSEKEKIELKIRIFKYYYLVNPFWKIRKKELSGPIHERIQKIFSVALPKKKLLSQRLVQLESTTGQIFPLSTMQKLAKGEKLKRLERISLKSYLERIKVWKFSFFKIRPNETPEYKVKVRFFHRLLKQLLELINSKNLGLDLNLPLLESKLCVLGLRIFENEDQDHVKWRESLPGTEINFADQQITVGKQIGKKAEGADHHAVFEIKDKPGLLLRVAKNEAALGIEYYLIRQTQYGIPYIDYLHYDKDGCYAIVERVTLTIDDISEQFVNHPSDFEVLYPIRDLLEELNTLKNTPDTLNIKEIGFTPSGNLRTFRWMKAGESNPPMIEKFVSDCAKGNQNFRSLLVRGSKMAVQENIKFYGSVLENAAEDRVIPVLRARVKHLEFNGNLNEKGQALAERISYIKKECKEELLQEYVVKNEKQLDQMINYCMKDYHRKHCLGSQLPRDFKATICSEVVKLLELKLKGK